MEKILEKSNYVGEITAIIRSSSTPNVMREKLEDYHENDIAEVLLNLSLVERKKLYRILNISMLSNILEYAETEDACRYLGEMDLRKAAQVIESMESDDALTVLRALDKTKRTYIMSCMSDDSRRDIALMASFDEDEIGSKMTTNYITLTAELSIKQAMHSLIEQAPSNDNISTLFVVDDNGCFYGAINLKELIIARQGTDLNSLIMTSYPYVYANESIDDCIENLKDYSEDLIPVLDNNNRLLGVITSQSIIEVVDDAMGDDYAKLAGLTAEEDLKEPLVESMKKRLPWLFILLGLGTLVSSVVGLFEQVVSQLTIIMCFQSLILDMSGNVGTQSLAVTIRVLMDESLTGKQKVGLVFKEMKVGLANGILLGICALVVLGLYIYLVKIRSLPIAFAISSCICISLIVAMVISSAVGTLIPLFFNKIHVDPAVASGPLITTINDLVAVVTYYGLSWLFILNILNISNVG
jgi:magnesium transporter